MNMIFQNYLNSEKMIYKYNEVPELMEEIRKNFRFSWQNSKIKYFNVPAAFDIETSSFYQRGEKCAITYVWQAGIYGCVVMGRTWEEFKNFIDDLSRILALDPERKRFIFYVHNLSYEFQFMRKHFFWYKVFSTDKRKPVYAITTSGIEFRCSYILSGYSLQKLGDELHTYDIHKKTGDLDYDLIRHTKTPLTKTEIGYCVNDVKVVMAYIQEEIERNGGIAQIPLTKTGYARKYCRNSCFYEPDKPKKDSYKRLRYKEVINALTLDPDEYRQLLRGFQGGFTHCNYWYMGKIITGVTSYDFTSSYPAVMVAEKYPMSAAEFVEIKNKEEFYKNLNMYCCLFDIEVTDLKPRVYSESYISRSRCFLCEDPVVNNGRIFTADRIRTTMTEQDFFIFEKMYKWKKIGIYNFRRYKKGYLPTDFIKAVLDLYQQKTELKGVSGKEVEYLKSKELLNSCYGMMVTNIVRKKWDYFDEWPETPEIPDLQTALGKYNKNGGRFLFYPWGVWVTAYARRNLFTGILHFGQHYIYSDTDSIKVLHAEYKNHQDYIRKYNDMIINKMEKAIDFHGISRSAIIPKTIKGEEKPLGVWDFDGYYTRFKTLGAKRYITEHDGNISITVAGLNKKKTVPWMIESGKDPFEMFNENLEVPAGFTGKLTHTYIDNERSGVITDYRGETAEYHELSSIHMEPGEYSISMNEYMSFIQTRREK